ncbi:MAG: hypothetical protein HZB26_02375 [Candidatus Hydrogenedentes bacterium]|nr:hypothetical protein [Candidatus Hydrogenedentota bacterium]
MNALFLAAKEVCEFMTERRWEFCIIGGLAVQRWGEPRTTMDAGITLLSGWGDEENYVTAILDHFQPRIADGRAFALSSRVLLIRASNGKDVDIALGALEFEATMVRRALAAPVEFAPGLVLPCCTAEDLFVMKAFAARPRDWLDAEGIVTRQPVLDKEYILEHLTLLCELKEAPEILERAACLLGEKP